MKFCKNILVGMSVATILTFIAIICFSFILTKTDIDERCTTTVVTIIFGVSILCGAVISTKKVQNKGAIIGGTMAATYVLAMYVISSAITSDFTLNLRSIIMISSAILLGALGGVIGVNIK